MFTLVHELAHIWIAESGISNGIAPELTHKDKLHPVELFCNEVAANALMPEYLMNDLDKNTFDSGDNIFKAAKKIGISSFALLMRAFNTGLISQEKYRRLKREADIEFRVFLSKEAEKKANQEKKKGGPNPYLLSLNKNSRLFTQIVIDAFRGGNIEPTLASTLLNTQVNNFPKFEALLYR